MIGRSLFIALVLLAVASTSISAQAAKLGKDCDLSIVGAKETKGFLDFDREFRYALSTQDAGVMALLVKPSLRVNDDRGSFYIQDAESLQLRFQDIFTPTVRDQVLRQRPETLTCLDSGVMYGDGVVWVNYTGQRHVIGTINVLARSRPSHPADRTAEFVCDADKHRVIVDAVGDGAPRYRAWTKPHSLSDKPDMEIASGKRRIEGSGVCAHTIWSFTSSGAEFDVDQPQICYEEGHPPPRRFHRNA